VFVLGYHARIGWNFGFRSGSDAEQRARIRQGITIRRFHDGFILNGYDTWVGWKLDLELEIGKMAILGYEYAMLPVWKSA